MSTALQKIMREIEALSPAERAEVKREIEARRPETPEEAFDRRLVESGVGTVPAMQRNPLRPINPTPIIIHGKLLSESLIEERR